MWGESVVIIGPFPPPFSGTTIKNFVLKDAFTDKKVKVFLLDSSRSRFNLFLKLIILLFRREEKNILASVSKNGRKFLVPYLYFSKTFFGKRTILMPCGGTIAEEINEMSVFKARFYKRFYKSLCALIVEAESIREKLFSIGITSNVMVVPNFKKRPPILEKNRGQSKVVKIVYLGRLSEKKGIFILIDAINLLVDDNKNVSLDFYGEFLDKDRDVKNKFIDLIKRNSSYINYCGFLSQDKIFNVLSDYDILAFPTCHKSEGFPGVLVDASFSGLPVVATDIAYNSEIITQRKNGLLCKPEDSESLASELSKLVDNRKLREKMGANNWAASSRFDSKIAAETIMKIFKKMDFYE